MNSFEKQNAENKYYEVYQCVKNAVTGFFKHPETVPCEYLPRKYSYIFRRKSRWELTKISSIVCGVEFCYAAETAFVAPVLLSLGLNVKYVSMVWFIGPLLTFFLTPILGSLSDSCQSRFGRRRPFIFMLTVGVIIGLIFIPYGGRIGFLLGDKGDYIALKNIVEKNHSSTYKMVEFESLGMLENNSWFIKVNNSSLDSLNKNTAKQKLAQKVFPNLYTISAGFSEENTSKLLYTALNESFYFINSLVLVDNASSTPSQANVKNKSMHLIGIILTIIGTIFLDFCADSLQSPCRAYLLDISAPEEHVAGLAIFCLNCGIGSAVGYGIAAIRWDVRLWGNVLEGQVVISFAILSIIYLLFVTCSLYSFPEIPLSLLKDPVMFKEYHEKRYKGVTKNDTEMSILVIKKQTEYSSTQPNNCTGVSLEEKIQTVTMTEAVHINAHETETKNGPLIQIGQSCMQRSFTDYLKSIFFMPKSLRILALTCFLYALSVISYTLFFTDYVGESVFNGNPQASKTSESYTRYKEGIRFGCIGMAFASLSCAIYSGFIEKIADRFGVKLVFIGGGLIYAIGMIIMAVAKHPVAVILLSACPGIMYSTLATVPFILLSNYHTSQDLQEDGNKDNSCIRGMGTDVGIFISIMVVSQCIMSFVMGIVVDAIGSTSVTVCSAALFSLCGAIAATQVIY